MILIRLLFFVVFVDFPTTIRAIIFYESKGQEGDSSGFGHIKYFSDYVSCL